MAAENIENRRDVSAEFGWPEEKVQKCVFGIGTGFCADIRGYDRGDFAEGSEAMRIVVKFGEYCGGG